jgi:RNA polymerase sigma-70 factor (ECF subfamily)
MNREATAFLGNTLPTEVERNTSASKSRLRPKESSEDVVAPLIVTLERSDEDLLLQVGNGNKDALSILFKKHARAVHGVARRILKDDSEAEDLLQELFLFIFQKAKSFDATKGSGTSWIIQMAYHRAIDRRRYLGFRQHYNGQELDENGLKAHRGQISINELAGRALLEKLRNELSPEQIQTLELHFFEGYSFHEIAEKTGQTFGNVRNHYYRGIERLRSHISPGKKSPK